MIRCVQQLGMVKLWERLKGTADLPDVASVDGSDLDRLREKLMVLDVSRKDGEPQFLVAFHGSDYKRINSGIGVGSLLQDVMPAAVRDSGLRSYLQVLDQRLPGFAVMRVKSEAGEALSYERLLLPFTRGGQEVEQIYCVLTLFVEDNSSPFDIVRTASGPQS